ncbi:hypothetical protein [Chlamydia sp. 17-3921]|uniref:hypothetical protein n=1 Tax=Chlamydia sp. 17-3921 TaxID=2675798 RepID=UPI0019191FF3|nr:hypothetical protein [Chlamydia sp. 17-3921]
MIKNFFIFSFILSSVFPVFSIFGEEEFLEENFHQKAAPTQVNCEENIGLDTLFLTLSEDGQGLCEELIALYQEDNCDNKHIFEVLACLPSGQKFINSCEKIFSKINVTEDEVTNETNLSEKFLQKLDEISQFWKHSKHSKEIDYANRELDIRERELEFRKDLLVWKKEYADKKLAWEKEKYAREALSSVN